MRNVPAHEFFGLHNNSAIEECPCPRPGLA